MKTFEPGTFTPVGRRGKLSRMLAVHARTEVMLTLRNGEQILLTLLIPLALLIGLALLPVIPVPADGVSTVDWTTPRILALAVMSSAFTGQAIALGFDRRYGVLKRLASTALPRWMLVSGRVVAALVVVGVQVVVLAVTALLLGWSPSPSGLAPALLLIIVGTLAFGALGVLLGGALRAEIVLALANAVWFVLLLAGGILLAPDVLPGPMAAVVHWLPSGALAEGLRAALIDGAVPWAELLALLGWAGVASAVATRTTKLT